jgi:hypothetical protein
MGARAEGLAAKLEAAHNDLVAAIEGASGEDWNSTCSDGEWTKGYAAYHAAANIGGISGMVRTVAGGQPFKPSVASWDAINAMNAEHAKEHAGCTPADALELLRRDGPDAVAMVRGLSDEQLDIKVPPVMDGMPELSVEQHVEMVLIGHTTEHLRTIIGSRHARYTRT